MAPEGLLPCPQEPATSFYSDLVNPEHILVSFFYNSCYLTTFLKF